MTTRKVLFHVTCFLLMACTPELSKEEADRRFGVGEAGEDLCAQEGWYEDHECDIFCPEVDRYGCAYCGDGVVEGSEECDDGNRFSGDGCTELCASESSLIDEIGLLCGDGALTLGEECDDGARQNGDGCSELCEVEDGFEREGVGPICGNGNLEYGEECDDGNRTSGDECSAYCQIERRTL